MFCRSQTYLIGVMLTMIWLIGYVQNMVKIFYADHTGEIVLRVIGIVIWPFGGVMGYL